MPGEPVPGLRTATSRPPGAPTATSRPRPSTRTATPTRSATPSWRPSSRSGSTSPRTTPRSTSTSRRSSPPSFANGVALRVVIGGDGAWTGRHLRRHRLHQQLHQLDRQHGLRLREEPGQRQRPLHRPRPSRTRRATPSACSTRASTTPAATKVQRVLRRPGDGRAPDHGQQLLRHARAVVVRHHRPPRRPIQDDMAVIARRGQRLRLPGRRPRQHRRAPRRRWRSPAPASAGRGSSPPPRDLDYFSFSTGAGHGHPGGRRARPASTTSTPSLELRDARRQPDRLGRPRRQLRGDDHGRRGGRLVPAGRRPATAATATSASTPSAAPSRRRPAFRSNWTNLPRGVRSRA